MSHDHQDLPPDWQPPEEENPPENLKRKWIEREYFGKETLECPFCHKHVPADTIDCIFCGKRMYYESGLMGKILYWVKRIFS